MKRGVTIIFAMLSALCVTTHADDYTWDVSISPIGAHEYEFHAKLKQYTTQESRVDSGVMQESKNILSVPTLKVTSDKPAEVAIGMPGKEPKIKAKVVMQETPQKVIFTYSAMVIDGTIRHTTQGKIEINR